MECNASNGEELTVNAQDKALKLQEMPADYKPSKPLEFIPLGVDMRDGFKMLSSEDAGEVIKRLFEYAVDYSTSYDASLEPDDYGLSELAKFMLKVCANSFRRMEDGRRETSFLRSGGNNGGRPTNK